MEVVKDKKLLIAGIDNGSTKGYALLGLNGDLIRVSSSKKYTLASLTREISREGRIVKIGGDVNPCPEFIKKLARSLNSKINTAELILLADFTNTIYFSES